MMERVHTAGTLRCSPQSISLMVIFGTWLEIVAYQRVELQMNRIEVVSATVKLQALGQE